MAEPVPLNVSRGDCQKQIVKDDSAVRPEDCLLYN